jgi:methyl-accepting chemotaxis protein
MPEFVLTVLRPGVAFMDRLRLRTKFIVVGLVAGLVVAWLLFYTAADATRAWVAVIGLGVTGYLSLAAYVSVLGAVRKIVEGGRRIAAGDLAVRVSLHSRDEYREIGEAFDAVAQTFAAVIRRVQDGAGQLERAAAELAQATRSIDESSRAQNQAVSRVADAVERVNAGVQRVAANAREVGELSHAASAKAAQGNESLSAMIGEIDRIEAAVTDIERHVGTFIADTRAIAEMTRQVKEIADQTNLLALNAAIEAARAGEQGRGFAVVADEVRKLAEKSARAAAQIDELTHALDTRSGEVEGAIRRGRDALEAGQENMETVAVVLSEASGSVARTSAGMAEIVASAGEQLNVSRDISHNIERIASMAGENSTAVSGVSAQARRLERLSRELSQAVRNYRT